MVMCEYASSRGGYDGGVFYGSQCCVSKGFALQGKTCVGCLIKREIRGGVVLDNATGKKLCGGDSEGGMDLMMFGAGIESVLEKENDEWDRG